MFKKEKNISSQTWISATFLLIFTAVFSKIFGFAREILIAKNFGISADVDAFLVALSIPLLIGSTIGVAFSFAFVPFYHKLANKNSLDESAVFIKSVFTFTLIVSIVLMTVVYFFPEIIINLIAPSLKEEVMYRSVELLKWLVFILIGVSLFNVLSSVYNAIHHFKIPAVTDMFSNLFVIASLVFLTSIIGIYSIVLGMISGYYFVLFVFLIHLFHHKLLGINFSFQSIVFKKFLSFVAPILVFMFFMQFIVIIENYFASSLKEGSIASLGYAKRLYDIIPTLLIANIARAVFPTFSMLYSEEKISELRDLVIKLNKQFIIYFLPITFALIFFRKEIISVVFMRGAFDATALELTSNAFMFYAMGLAGATLIPVFFRLCYAFSDSISPMISIIISIVFMIALNYLLTPVMGISGIALTSSLSVFLTLFLLGFFVRKKIGGINVKDFSFAFIVSFTCAFFALIPFFFIPMQSVFYCIFLIPLYFILYLFLGLLVSKKEFSLVWISLKRIFVK